jgi:hypothetical protein
LPMKRSGDGSDGRGTSRGDGIKNHKTHPLGILTIDAYPDLALFPYTNPMSDPVGRTGERHPPAVSANPKQTSAQENMILHATRTCFRTFH